MSIEILDGGGPGTASFSQLIDGGIPITVAFDNQADAGGAIRGVAVTAQGNQNVQAIEPGLGSVATSQGESVQATGTVTIAGAVRTSQGESVEATGTVTITGSATTAQGRQTVHATNVIISGAVVTAQGSESVHAVGTVQPYVPPKPPQPVPGQYGGGLGGGGGVAGGYVISLSGFRRNTIEITVCIPGELPNTIEVQQQDVIPLVSVSGVSNSARTMQVVAGNPVNVLTKRPAYNLSDIINTTESNVSAKVLFQQPRAQINDITTIDP